MENWGLVTYRERLLLADDLSPISSRQLVALVVGHELAHQWFGNLVCSVLVKVCVCVCVCVCVLQCIVCR